MVFSSSRAGNGGGGRGGRLGGGVGGRWMESGPLYVNVLPEDFLMSSETFRITPK